MAHLGQRTSEIETKIQVLPSWEKCGQSAQANGEDLAIFSILLEHAMQITFQKYSGKSQRAKSLRLLLQETYLYTLWCDSDL